MKPNASGVCCAIIEYCTPKRPSIVEIIQMEKQGLIENNLELQQQSSISLQEFQ